MAHIVFMWLIGGSPVVLCRGAPAFVPIITLVVDVCRDAVSFWVSVDVNGFNDCSRVGKYIPFCGFSKLSYGFEAINKLL